VKRRSVQGKRKPRAREPGPSSPIVRVRHIPSITRLLLFVRAGGQCEFDSCHQDVLSHPLTLTEGNFAQVAHIVAFRRAGPRGNAKSRPKDIHDASNLMLLCPQCHKLVDDHPADYTRRTLETYKKRHEKWIKHVTGLTPDRKTSLIVVKSPIGKQTVSIPFDHMLEAVSPRYPVSRDGLTIDLTNLLEENDAVTEAARQVIATSISRFFAPGGEWEEAGHVSVFALAPMAVLAFFGSQLGNKVPIDLFQRHRDTESWAWKNSGKPVEYASRTIQRGTDPCRAAMLLSLSGAIPPGNLPSEIDASFFIYELTLKDVVPSTIFLRTRVDLENFRTAYQAALASIAKTQGNVKCVHLFPAVPAPVAVLCGRELLPKIHPELRVYDYDKAKQAFSYQLSVNS
jgi:hypothetical protein